VSRQLFIYWRVAPASLDAALQAVRVAQQQLQRDWPGLSAHVYERCDPAPEATVMETYQAPAGIDAAAEKRIESALTQALAGLPAGPRHVEAFVRR
jgi:hypothetical protein